MSTEKKNWVYEAKPITVARGVGYGMMDLMGGGWNNIVSGVIFTFLLAQGLDPSAAGGVTFFARIFDAIFSLFFGTITDEFYKTKLGKRFGRRHFFIFVGGIAFAIIFPMFWFPASTFGLGGHEFWYYLLVNIGMEIVIAFIMIPWETLPTEMTEDYNKRTVLSGSRMFISATGTAIVFFVLAILKHIGNDNAYLITGLIYTVIFVIAIFISWRTTWERPLNEDVIAELESRPKLGFVGAAKKSVIDYASTFKNKAFRKHLTVYLLSFTGKDFYSTLLPTFMVFAVGSAADFPWVLQALSAFGILSTLLAAKLMISKGPRFLFILAYSGILLSLVGYGVTYATHSLSNVAIWAFIIISVVYQMSRAVLEFTPWNVFPFIPDVDRIMTREDRAGIYAAVMTFFRKSTGALASAIAGILLTEIGFKSDMISGKVPVGITHGITLIFILGPGILILLALIASFFFRLNKETHTILKNEINRLEAGGSKEDVTPETRKVTEALTGHPYETLWPETPLSLQIAAKEAAAKK
ncbi:MAG: MFS transporter [Lactobacillales bacterium]|jgi:oligogalacturonide transporter|nr:MFS transporter [Lactobacillales bacterium]